MNNRNPEDDNSEDDDDCEIIEQNTTVIEVDSDDEAASTTGKEKAATEGAAGGSSAKKAPKTVAQPAAPKDGPANTLTVGEIVVTWKVTGVSDTPGQTQTPAQIDKEGPVTIHVRFCSRCRTRLLYNHSACQKKAQSTVNYFSRLFTLFRSGLMLSYL